MSKSVYFSVVLLLGVNFWGLMILERIFNGVTNPFFAVLWAFMGIYWFRTKPSQIKDYNFYKYNNYFFWLIVGFALSVFSANEFWNQGWSTGIIVNRFLIWYIFLPMLLYIQPTGEQIMKAIQYYSILYIIVWTVQAVTPFPIYSSLDSAIEIGRGKFELAETDFGQLIPGYSVILLLLYYKTQQMRENPNLRNTIYAFALMIFFFLLQNRGALFFAVIVFGYALLTMRARYRYLLVPIFLMIAFIGYVYSAEHWSALFTETIDQLNDPFTNRWRAFYFFAFDYAPHWMCNILGNGLLSAHIPAGEFIQDMMDQGYYQYDNGMVGFWSQYGVLPLLVLYTVILKVLFNKAHPFYLKAMAAHILFMPIAWNFGSSDILIFATLVYLYAFHREQSRFVNTANIRFRPFGEPERSFS